MHTKFSTLKLAYQGNYRLGKTTISKQIMNILLVVTFFVCLLLLFVMIRCETIKENPAKGEVHTPLAFLVSLWVTVHKCSTNDITFDRTAYAECIRKRKTAFTSGSKIDWNCIQRSIVPVTSENREQKVPRSTAPPVTKSGPSLNRVRKEYRTLTDEERGRFHSAMNALKKDVLPGGTSKYDAIAKLHTGQTLVVAHGGPGFLTWHRQYLLILEDALREYEPEVAIPYWDSTLDNEMDDPRQSIIWDDTFMGTGRGEITGGPFNNWPSPSKQLTRNIATKGRLFSNADIARIFNQTSIQDITQPHAPKQNNIELLHGNIHDWVGGHMGSLHTASYDPMFFMHHSFVDYLYEEFRDLQTLRGVDEATDWPVVYGAEFHAPNAKISISDTMTHKDMAAENIKDIYVYAPRPKCTNNDSQCGSPYLRCDVNKKVCVSRTSPQVEPKVTALKN